MTAGPPRLGGRRRAQYQRTGALNRAFNGWPLPHVRSSSLCQNRYRREFGAPVLRSCIAGAMEAMQTWARRLGDNPITA